GIGADLSRYVDLNRAVYRRYFRVSPNNGSIVYISRIKQNHERIVIDEIIQFSRSHHEGADHLSRMHSLHFSVNDAAFNQRHYSIREHLGMNSQILMITEHAQNSIGNGSYAHL